MPQLGMAEAEAAQGRAPEVTQLHMAPIDENAEMAVKTPHWPTRQLAPVFRIADDLEHEQTKSELAQPTADPTACRHPVPHAGRLDAKPAQGDAMHVVAAGNAEMMVGLRKGVGVALGVEEVVPILPSESRSQLLWF